MSEFLDYEGLSHFKDKILSKLPVDDSGDYTHRLNKIEDRLDLIAKNLAGVYISLEYEDGTPASELYIDGIVDADKNAGTIKTDENGFAKGYLVDVGTHTLSLNSYADVTWSTSISVTLGELYEVSGTVTKRQNRLYSSTKNIRFSNTISSIDFAIVGGGGGGGGSYISGVDGALANGGYGGGGGSVVEQELQLIEPNELYQFSCGSGGSEGSAGNGVLNITGSNGNSGGSSSFMGISAAGGSGGFISTTQTPPSTLASIGGAYGARQSGGSGAAASSASGGVYYKSTWKLGGGGGGGGAGGPAETTFSSIKFSWDRSHSSGSMAGGSGGSLGTSYISTFNGYEYYGTAGSGISGSYGGGGGGGAARPWSKANAQFPTPGSGGKGGDGALAIVFNRVSSTGGVGNE